MAAVKLYHPAMCASFDCLRYSDVFMMPRKRQALIEFEVTMLRVMYTDMSHGDKDASTSKIIVCFSVVAILSDVIVCLSVRQPDILHLL